jgi:hypothetical protein
MKLQSLIVDGFLEDFARWRAWCDTATYGDVVSDVDRVTYPGICADLPPELREEIRFKLQALASMQRMDWLFARLSPRGSHPPHFAHHDGSMGQWSMMLYMNRAEHCDGGTAMLAYSAGREPSEEEWRRDTNKPSQWNLRSVCDMQPNRAFIFRAEQWHAALPTGGFGTTPADARLVITSFFS